MKRFLIAGFAFVLLLSLTGCWGGSTENDPPDEPYWADGELTQAEVRGHYDIRFQAVGEEAFGYPVDFITLDGQLAMVLRPNQSDALTLSFDSYAPKTGTAQLEQSEERSDGTYTLFCEITFAEQNGKLVFEGTYTVELDGVVKDDYAISGNIIWVVSNNL